MFNTIVFHGSPEQAPYVRAAVAATGLLSVMREFNDPPGSYELRRVMNTLGPEVVVMDLSGGQAVFERAAQIRSIAPQIALIAYGCTPDLLRQVTQAGFDSAVAPQAPPEDLRLSIREALELRNGGIERCLYSFLPSKAGSGASTVALNTALAMGRMGKRVLVIDADLRSGILAIMLGIEPRTGVQGLLRRADELDQFALQNTVVQMKGVDFLFSTREPDSTLPEWHQYYHLLNFAAARYDAILVDLPEIVNPASRELVRRSRLVFPVCTPEIPSLRLTLRRCQELAELGIPDERLGVIVNRWHRTDPDPDEIASMIGKPILKTLPNDYAQVRAAIAEGRGVDPESELGRTYAEFSAQLGGDAPPAAREYGFGERLKGLFRLSTG